MSDNTLAGISVICFAAIVISFIIFVKPKDQTLADGHVLMMEEDTMIVIDKDMSREQAHELVDLAFDKRE